MSRVADTRGPLGLKQDMPKTKVKKPMRRTAQGKKFSSDCSIMKSARGEACLADWCGCNGSTETTVMCHVRKFGIGGMAMKPPNWMGFYACHKAHMMFDQTRDGNWSWEGVLRAVLLTQMKLRAKGLLPL